MVQVLRSPPDEHPVNPDTGRFYRYGMVTAHGLTAYGQTWRELCEALIDGYGADEIRARLEADGVPPDEMASRFRIESATRRIMYALKVQVWLQAQINADHQDEVTALGDPSREVMYASRVGQPDISAWDEDIPLVLVAYQYEPYGQKPKPEGNIIWLNPFSDEALIRSLHDAGEIVLSARSDLAEVVSAG